MDNLIYTTEKIELIKGQIQFYETSYKICILGFLIFLFLTIFLFFSLHIGNAISHITGIYKTKEIGRIRQMAKGSGNLVGGYMKGHLFVYTGNQSEELTEELFVEEEVTVLLDDMQQSIPLPENEFILQENVFLGCEGKWIE